jgi:hypothetical protein
MTQSRFFGGMSSPSVPSAAADEGDVKVQVQEMVDAIFQEVRPASARSPQGPVSDTSRARTPV